MISFSEYFPNQPLEHLKKLSELQDSGNILSLLKTQKGVELFATLLSPAAEDIMEYLAAQAALLTDQRHGKIIRFYAPIYISNECTNTCTYCGFTMENKILRKTLTNNEIDAESAYLKKRGFRHVLLVSGEHQKIVTAEFVGKMVDQTKPFFSSISIETAPFTVQEYEYLVQRGVEGLALYQETYDKDVYKSVHLHGKKKNYDWRLTAPERGAQAHMRKIGMGVLLGLAADWKMDSICNAVHMNYMMKHYWRVQYSVSLPRICSSETNYQPAVNVSDKDFTQLILAYRIAFPDIGISLSTREKSTLRDGLIGLGITHMSAESATDPGGYTCSDQALKQFEITDERKVEEIFPIISKKGYEPVFKDGDTCLVG